MSGTQRFSIALLFLLWGALIVFGVFKLIEFGKLMDGAAEQPLTQISQPQPVVSEPPPLHMSRAVGPSLTQAPLTPSPIPQVYFTQTDTACIYLSTLGGIAILPKRAGGC